MPDIDKALLEKCARALLEDERKHGGCPAALDMQAHIVLEASGLLAENAALKARVAELEELLDRLCIHLTEIHPMLPRSNHDRYASGEIPVRIWLEVASATGQLDWAVRYLQNNNPDALAEWRCGNDECTLNITNDPWPCSTCEKNNGGDCECNRLSHWRGREMGRFRADLATAQRERDEARERADKRYANASNLGTDLLNTQQEHNALTAQVGTIATVLAEMEAEKEPLYGLCCVSDPRNFTPDSDTTPEEMAAWTAACERVERGEKDTTVHSETVRDEKGEFVAHIDYARWGYGINMIPDEVAQHWAKRIREALTPTQAEQQWRAMRDVCEAGIAFKQAGADWKAFRFRGPEDVAAAKRWMQAKDCFDEALARYTSLKAGDPQ